MPWLRPWLHSVAFAYVRVDRALGRIYLPIPLKALTSSSAASPKDVFSACCLCLAILLLSSGCQGLGPTVPAGEWTALFDGKALGDWEPVRYGTQGVVEVENRMIYIEYGQPLSGIRWVGKDLPRSNYEIEIEAQRLNGNDFFCTLAFPAGESECSLVVGGWGGTVVGLSNVDGEAASENPTRKIMFFDNGRWYRIRLRVTDRKIQAWVDGKTVVDLDRRGKKIDIHPAVGPSLPLGISTFASSAFVRNIRLRRLD